MTTALAFRPALDEPRPRWLEAAGLVLLAHAGLLIALDRLAEPTLPAAPPPAAILIDLPATPAAPAVEPEAEPAPEPAIDIPLPPLLQEPLPEPVFDPPEPVAELPPEPVPEPVPEPAPPADPVIPEPPTETVVEQPVVALIPPPPRRPRLEPQSRVEAPRREPQRARPPERAAAPPPAATPAPAEASVQQAAAPTRSEAPPPPRSANAMPTWQGALLAHLERHKRYPASARSRRQEGTAQIRFTIDRQGHVVAATLARSSGHAALDDETMSMLERAAPLPAPPFELGRDTVELVVPVQFFLR